MGGPLAGQQRTASRRGLFCRQAAGLSLFRSCSKQNPEKPAIFAIFRTWDHAADGRGGSFNTAKMWLKFAQDNAVKPFGNSQKGNVRRWLTWPKPWDKYAHH
jgi:hypothetical protein